jgi:hypothetical protein
MSIKRFQHLDNNLIGSVSTSLNNLASHVAGGNNHGYYLQRCTLLLKWFAGLCQLVLTMPVCPDSACVVKTLKPVVCSSCDGVIV